MTLPMVSVVMPVYNGEFEHVKEAIDSILLQSFTSFELIIVDDGSSNGVESLLQTYAEQNERISLLRNESNLGVVASRNRGVDQSQGKYIACMDSDDIALPDRLQIQVEYLETHPEVSVNFTAFTTIDMNSEPLEAFPVSQDSDLLAAELLLNSRLCASTMMCRAQALKSVGGYQSGRDYADDYALYIKLLDGGYKLTGIDQSLLRYRITPGGLTQSRRHDQLSTAQAVSYEHVAQKVDLIGLEQDYQSFWFFIAYHGETKFSLRELKRLRPFFEYIRQDDYLSQTWWSEFQWVSRMALSKSKSLSSVLIHLYFRWR